MYLKWKQMYFMIVVILNDNTSLKHKLFSIKLTFSLFEISNPCVIFLTTVPSINNVLKAYELYDYMVKGHIFYE